jgi:hypothetical protein
MGDNLRRGEVIGGHDEHWGDRLTTVGDVVTRGHTVASGV